MKKLQLLFLIAVLATLALCPSFAEAQTMMKAIVAHEYGSPEVLKYEDVPRPEPKENEALVRVMASAVNPADPLTLSGKYAKEFGTHLPLIPGYDIAGTVEKTGSNVTRLKVGDAVYGYPTFGGGWAEFVLVTENEVAAKPSSLGFTEAAAVPMGALTAWQALVDVAQIAPGQTILIHGGSGGVGSFAVQIAKARGARVIATASTANQDLLKQLGADVAIDYTKTKFEDLAKEVDAVLDPVGKDTLARSYAVVKKGGIVMSLVARPDPSELEKRGIRGASISVHPDADDLAEIAQLIDAKKIKPVVTEVLPFSDGIKAQQQAATHHTRGKLVLRIADEPKIAGDPKPDTPPGSASEIAVAYVKLVLAMGQHDKDYVDAYYGPPAWQEQAAAAKKPLDAIREEAMDLFSAVAELPFPIEEIDRLRLEYLARQLSALETRVRIVKGERLKFDDESRALYDAVAPVKPESHFQEILNRLEKKLPGKGPLSQRYEEWRKQFIIPREKLDTVFQLAIKECRQRTLAHIKLPPEESFTVEYVTGKSWGGYNWYQGKYHSLIQVNTDLPAYIDRAVDLAAHEGYPGHHVYNVLLEKNLVRDRGWVEFSVYPLFSPQSLIAEGTANFGREVAFTKAERMQFEKKVLFPAAGIDPGLAEKYYAIQEMAQELSFAGNEAARRYLDGEIDATAAKTWLERFALMDPKRADQRVRFMDQYRSYVINYNLGEELVRKSIEKRGGTADQPAKRWQEFGRLISSPRLPSGL